MPYKNIPEGSTEIQKGLWLHTYNQKFLKLEFTFKQLFSAPGYCFYDKTLPLEQRTYMTFANLGMVIKPEKFVSVVRKESYKCV